MLTSLLKMLGEREVTGSSDMFSTCLERLASVLGPQSTTDSTRFNTDARNGLADPGDRPRGAARMGLPLQCGSLEGSVTEVDRGVQVTLPKASPGS